MEEDFYYIDFSIDGIEYKLEKEINAFFNLNQYTITCEDDLAVVADGESRPIVTINSHETYQKYKDNMKNWSISDSSGALVPLSDFKDAFPLTNQYCIRLRKKTNSSIDTYHVLSDEEVKAINSIIVADTKDIVFSELENISHIV